MDDMVAQGFGAIIIIYGALIAIAVGIVFFIERFWNALVQWRYRFYPLVWCDHSGICIIIYRLRSFTPQIRNNLTVFFTSPIWCIF